MFAICLSDSRRTYLRRRSSRFHAGSMSLPMTPRSRKTFSCSDVYRLPNIRAAYSLASFSLLKTLARPRFGRMIHIVPCQKPRFNCLSYYMNLYDSRFNESSFATSEISDATRADLSPRVTSDIACRNKFVAALMSRSWCAPQSGHVHSRTCNGIFS